MKEETMKDTQQLREEFIERFSPVKLGQEDRIRMLDIADYWIEKIEAERAELKYFVKQNAHIIGVTIEEGAVVKVEDLDKFLSPNS